MVKICYNRRIEGGVFQKPAIKVEKVAANNRWPKYFTWKLGENHQPFRLLFSQLISWVKHFGFLLLALVLEAFYRAAFHIINWFLWFFFSFSKKCNRISLKCSNSQGGQSDININQLFNINGMCCAFSKKVLQSKILFSSCFSLFYFRKESFLLNFFFQYLTNEGGHGRRTNSR